MNRAYSILQVKSFDEEQRIIEGIASTPTADRMGDIVDPLGAVFNLPIPLLWQHDDQQPIGNVIDAKITPKGIVIKAQLVQVDAPSGLKARLEEAWQSIKTGLVRGLSIGFSVLESEPIKNTHSYIFSKWDWLELSAVTIPANAEASIQLIKSIDKKAMAASGKDTLNVKEINIKTSGVSGKKEINKRRADMAEMTTREQIEAFQTQRNNKAALMDTIMKKANEENTTLDAQQIEEYETLKAEVKALDDHTARLEEHEKVMVAKATPLNAHNIKTIEAGSQARSGPVVRVAKQVPKGTTFARYVMALVKGHGHPHVALEISKAWQDTTPELETIFRSAVAAGTTTDETWAGKLVEYQTMSSEFIELLRDHTIIDRLPNLRRVPFNVKIPRQTQGSSAQWIGETKPTPVSKMGFDNIKLDKSKASGIVTFSKELMRFGEPSVEALVTKDLIDGMAGFLNAQFIDPSITELLDVHPASITNGATTVTSSGTDANAVRKDIEALFKQFNSKKIPVANCIWVMSSNTALTLSLMRNPLGQQEFPDINMNGGTFFGLPVVTSGHVPAANDGDIIVLVDPSEILWADDDIVTIDTNTNGALVLSDDPGNDNVNMVSLWQTHMVAIMATRYINWKRRRDEAVGYITQIKYESASSFNFEFDVNCNCDHSGGNEG